MCVSGSRVYPFEERKALADSRQCGGGDDVTARRVPLEGYLA